ncbi:MAG: VWA domain-containing protein [Planctomycetaceae bacterium]|nr:VWA domain-containing protein [Planctomycetaceae bacterium]
MPASTTTNIEQITYDGPVSLSAAILIGLALLVLFAWSLWNERRILGRGQTVLFWMLRGITLAVVLWMLLAPSSVQVVTSTTRRAVSFVTDVSGSMTTVDPAGTSDDLRWAIAQSETPAFPLTESADRAVVALEMARQHLNAASDAIRRHASDSEVVEQTNAAELALQRMNQHLETAASTAPTGSRAKDVAERLMAAGQGAEFEAFKRLSSALRKDRSPEEKGWRESQPDLENRLAALSRSVHELARHAAGEEALWAMEGQDAILTSVQEQSRLGHASQFLNQLEQSTLKTIREKADVRLSVFDDQMRPLTESQTPATISRPTAPADADPAAIPGTNIASVLEQIHRDRQEQPLAAVFVLTDAVHNTLDTDPREAAAALKDTPIYVVPIGNTEHVRDVILQSVYAPAVAMRNDAVVIEARIQAYDCAGEICTVQLLQDGQVIDFREVLLDSESASRNVRFEQQMPSIGNQKFQVAVVPADGELTEDNNFGDVEINVTRSDIKLLLSDEHPRWEYRYLAQLFRRDPRIECDELLFHPRLIATGRREQSQTFPATVDDWDQYDVVMLGDIATSNLSTESQQTLLEYLRLRGGTLVMIAGREWMPHQYVGHPLQNILPVGPIDSATANSDRYTFRVTEEGTDHLALMIGETDEATRTAWDFVNRFSPLRGVSDWRKPGPLAHTLIAAVPVESVDEVADEKASAFLCWQPVGRGRVIYLSGPDTWRLRHLRGDRLHYRFWGQLLRWAIAAELSGGTEFVRIRTDRSQYESHEEVRVTVRLTDDNGTPVSTDGLEVRVSGGEEEHVLPLVAREDASGEYEAVIPRLSSGVYRVEPVGKVVDELQKDSTFEAVSASFTVSANLPDELVLTRSDRVLAQQIADITGGQVLPPTAVEEIIALTNLEPIVSEIREESNLWVRWKYLWIVFGCLQTEWIIRKWKGLS